MAHVIRVANEDDSALAGRARSRLAVLRCRCRLRDRRRQCEERDEGPKDSVEDVEGEREVSRAEGVLRGGRKERVRHAAEARAGVVERIEDATAKSLGELRDELRGDVVL